MLVVHFQHLDVEVRIEGLRDLARHGNEQVHAEAHVAGLDDRRVAGGGLDRGIVLGREAGRTDYVDDARIGGEAGNLDADFGHREVENAVHLGDDVERIGRDRHADPADAGKLARVLTDGIGTGPLDRSRDDGGCNFGVTAGRMNGADQLAPHAARGSHHGQLHRAHRICPDYPCELNVLRPYSTRSRRLGRGALLTPGLQPRATWAATQSQRPPWRAQMSV